MRRRLFLEAPTGTLVAMATFSIFPGGRSRTSILPRSTQDMCGSMADRQTMMGQEDKLAAITQSSYSHDLFSDADAPCVALLLILGNRAESVLRECNGTGPAVMRGRVWSRPGV